MKRKCTNCKYYVTTDPYMEYFDGDDDDGDYCNYILPAWVDSLEYEIQNIKQAKYCDAYSEINNTLKAFSSFKR